MKSYDEHLKTLLSKTPTHHCHRSSALFPIFCHANCQMRLLFLNYWMLKRKIDSLLCRLYVRSLKGETVLKKCFSIEEIKGYEIALSELIPQRFPFGGSIEIEFSSAHNLVFPFPAVVVHYQGKGFSTFVHAASRSYNDQEDERVNQNSQSIESGFNIYTSKACYPFLTYINGKKELKNETLLLAAYNQKQEVIASKVHLSCQPNETLYLHLDKWKELKSHLGEQAGCLKVKIPSKGVFPRLIVGNYSKRSETLSVTHSYYDLSQQNSPSDYWQAPTKDWHAATLLLPLFQPSQFETRVFFYPIYSPTPFRVDATFYSLEGKKIKSVENLYTFEKDPSFTQKDLHSFIEELDPHIPYLCRLIAQPLENSKIPSRIKIGYDVAFKKGGFACNICTNFNPANPGLESKKKTFKWAPLMPQLVGGEVWCLNDAPKKNYSQKAPVKLTFYRNLDGASIKKQIDVPAHGAYRIRYDEQLTEFMNGKTGWCTFESENPYITSYTFSLHPSKMVGADHGF